MMAQPKLDQAPVAGACIPPETFRSVMRALGGSVTVISTESEGKLYGFTATAVCSVCAEPAMLLIAVNRTARTHAHIARRSAFAVNILAEDQVDVATLFAGKGDDQFANIHHVISDRGIPIIEGVAAHFDCAVDSVQEVGTHSVFIGRVLNAESSGARPLVYQGAQYCRLTGTA